MNKKLAYYLEKTGWRLLGTALRDSLREGYGRRQLLKDLTAGLLVGVVAIPLAMALSIAVGLPPEHGLYTAAIAGFLAALLGGSRIQVVGPTAAFVAILAPIVARHGLQGLLLTGFLSGLLLALIGALRMGSLIEYIPFPVITGFTSGIAVVIAGLQLKDVFGLQMAALPEHLPERLMAYWDARATASGAEALIASSTLAILLIPRLPRRWIARLPNALKRAPAPLLALPLLAGAAWLLKQHGVNVITLGDRFQQMINGQLVRGVPQQLPSLRFPWLNADGSWVSLQTVRELLPGVLTVTVLAAIESLLSAVVADGMIRSRHEPNAELLALGIANVAAPFFGGIPATGAIARTATNFRYGGRTPIAAMAHAVTVGLAILLLAPLLAYLPMASLASLLLVVAWNMAEVDHFKHILRSAPKPDVWVLLTCFSLTIIFDMAMAVMAGTLLASVFLIKKVTDSARGQAHTEHANLPAPLPADVVYYHMEGPLFFGSAEKAIGAIRGVGPEARAVIFDLRGVPSADISGFVAVEAMLEEMERLGIKAVFVGVRPAVRQLFDKAGLKEGEGRLAYCAHLTEAYQLLSIRLPRMAPRRPGLIRFHATQRHRGGASKGRRQSG
jgi:SulP family sulfate permease